MIIANGVKRPFSLLLTHRMLAGPVFFLENADAHSFPSEAHELIQSKTARWLNYIPTAELHSKQSGLNPAVGKVKKDQQPVIYHDT